MKSIGKLLILIVIITGAIGVGYLFGTKKATVTQKTTPQNIYTVFLSEVYDKVKENYWEKIADEQLINLYILGTEKLTGQVIPNKPKNKTELETLMTKTVDNIADQQKKKEFTAGLADIVLANLQPFSRSRLYSQKMETDLKNTVENRDTTVDLYKILDSTKSAKPEELKQAYEKKTAELKQDKTPEGAQKLAQVERAHTVLTDPGSRSVYDQNGVEPTIITKLIRPEIFYMHLTKFSPTTMDELVRVTKNVDQGDKLDTLILDLRGNIGGAIDGLPYFLGPFIGNDQYAYQFMHQGEKTDYKTKMGWLPSLIRYKKVVILINEQSQSTAEVMATSLKKYNVGVFLGNTTKGWGTIEKVFPLQTQIDPKETYSLFLVHTITLRDDGLPIEGKGVDPNINIKDPNWEKELYARFRYPDLTEAIKEIVK